MRKPLTAFLVLMLISISAVADQDMIAQLSSSDLASSGNVYTALEPLGQIRARLSATVQDRQILEVTCNLFKSIVPSEGLADLPRPDWSALSVTFSVRPADRQGLGPYISLKVPLGGPPGVAWEQTWAEFHFDSRGTVSRRITRQVRDPVPNATVHTSRDWKIGAGITAEAALAQPRK
jgi:hypothetical protein